uniref:Neprosin PEP catalytic domain-containing protein n=1 Tax=Acorus calamus TaxID=4465 RepID=A0AAV9EER5_ACOCL|nr:hypothetical protein QJS10_CPA07g00928 [Acorus calamus]
MTHKNYHNQPNSNRLDTDRSRTYEYAIVRTKDNIKYSGAKADIHVWKPLVWWGGDFSIAQMWLVHSERESTVEVGWHVYPDLYNDDKTRLFTYWTGDGYVNTGCYNLVCSGFVQVGSEISLGSPLSPVSAFNGPHYQININVFQDVENGNWWLEVQNDMVGYWPSSIVPKLASGAEEVQYGGEILDKKAMMGERAPHTITEMGNGHFSEDGKDKAAAFSNIQLLDMAQSGYKMPPDLNYFAPKPYCYDIALDRDKNWGMFFVYGGPGRNPECL